MTSESWHLSKSIPISFLLGMILQTASLAWFISSLDSQVTSNTENAIKLEKRVDDITLVVQSQAVLLARIDENIKAIRQNLER